LRRYGRGRLRPLRTPGMRRRSSGLAVAPAKAGPIPRNPSIGPGWQLPSPNDDLWLWAPAFAGATAWMLFASSPNRALVFARASDVLASASDAMTTARHDKNSRGAFRPSYANRSAPRKDRGRREDRVPATHPRPPRAKKDARARVDHRWRGNHAGLPCAVVYGL